MTTATTSIVRLALVMVVFVGCWKSGPTYAFSITGSTRREVGSSSSLLKGHDQSPSKNDNLPDLDYFDPFAISPHAYPKGIPDDETIATVPTTPTMKKPFGFDYRPSISSRQQPASTTTQSVIPPETFDPRISPHEYSTNNKMKMNPPPTLEIEETASTTPTKKRVGILIMDHGSKNPAANQRLQDLATLYQQSQDFCKGGNSDTVEFIVTASHMEIATPSIPQGLEYLLSQNVEEIICHPYFLSPGRHVTKDIPAILEQAKIDLSIPSSLPVTTTEPVGSNTLLMMGAIHALVKEHSQVLKEDSYTS
jgi:CbiX